MKQTDNKNRGQKDSDLKLLNLNIPAANTLKQRAAKIALAAGDISNGKIEIKRPAIL
jgi:hypothetical protein